MPNAVTSETDRDARRREHVPFRKGNGRSSRGRRAETSAERTMATPGCAPIVVGVDPGPWHHQVLAWSADEADRRRTPLRLVHAQGRPADPHALDHPYGGGRTRHTAAEHALRDAVAFVADRHPGLEVSALLAADHPVPLLRRQARTAAVVVLGSRRSEAREQLFGSASVALQVMVRTTCPVVVVRESGQVAEALPHFVVGVDVGVDGRSHSTAAVDHAFAAAARHRAVLRVLYVWHPPLLGVMDEHAALRECRELLSELVESRRAAYPEVDVHHEVVHGRPARVLARESADALGLVVGVGGGFTGMPLGSVVRGVLQRATCPVVAVPRCDGPASTSGRLPISRVPRRARVASRRHPAPAMTPAPATTYATAVYQAGVSAAVLDDDAGTPAEASSHERPGVNGAGAPPGCCCGAVHTPGCSSPCRTRKAPTSRAVTLAPPARPARCRPCRGGRAGSRPSSGRRTRPPAAPTGSAPGSGRTGSAGISR